MYKTIIILIFPLLIASCSKKIPNIDPIPNHDNFTIESNIVNEQRVINVWTPPNYKKKPQPLPVLYMPDGGIKEDFPHIANTVAKLVKNRSIPPVILVGIENTIRGRDLTGHSDIEDDAQYCPTTDGAKNFRGFISEELIPTINKKYNTSSHKGIIGESLAGLFVMETFFLKPQTFNFYIAIDPSIWWNDHYLEREAKNYLNNIKNEKIKLWFAGSGAEDISIFTNKVARTLHTQAPESLTWKYSDEPNEEHHTIFRATKEKALIWSLSSLK